MKEVLAKYTEWYKEGLINPEFATTDMEKMFRRIQENHTSLRDLGKY